TAVHLSEEQKMLRCSSSTSIGISSRLAISNSQPGPQNPSMQAHSPLRHWPLPEQFDGHRSSTRASILLEFPRTTDALHGVVLSSRVSAFRTTTTIPKPLKLAILACLLAAAAASSYTLEQKYEVYDAVLHEALPALSVDWNCVLSAGASSASCVLSALLGCGVGSSDLSSIVKCLVSNLILPAAALLSLAMPSALAELTPSLEQALMTRLGLLGQSAGDGSYSPAVRPKPDNGSANTVIVQAIMSALAAVVWNDNRLAWRGRFNSSFDSIATVFAPAELAWQPDVSFLDSLSLQRVSGDRVLLNLTSAGGVAHSQQFMVRFKCRFDMRNFPYDAQRCGVKIGSIMQSSASVRVRMMPASEVEFSGATGSHEFCVQSVFTEEGAEGEFPFVRLVVVFSRRSTFYLVNIVIPSLLLLAISTLVFRLPPECGERMSLSVTIVLSMCVFLQLAGSYTPTQSEAVPLLKVKVCLLLMLVSDIKEIRNSVSIVTCCHLLKEPTASGAVAMLTMGSLLGNVFVLDCHFKLQRGGRRVFSPLVRLLFLNRCITGNCKRTADARVLPANKTSGSSDAETEEAAGREVNEWLVVVAAADRCLFALFLSATLTIAVAVCCVETSSFHCSTIIPAICCPMLLFALLQLLWVSAVLSDSCSSDGVKFSPITGVDCAFRLLTAGACQCKLFLFDACSHRVQSVPSCTHQVTVYVRSLPGVPPGRLCPSGYEHTKYGTSYKITSSPKKNWQTANQICSTQPGLSKFADAIDFEEAAYLRLLVRADYNPDCFLGGKLTTDISTATTKSNWVWTACNLTIDASVWQSGQPDGVNFDGSGCANLCSYFSTGGIDDHGCDISTWAVAGVGAKGGRRSAKTLAFPCQLVLAPLVLAPLAPPGAGAPGAGALVLAPLVLAPLVLAPLVLAPLCWRPGAGALVLAPLVLAPLVLAPLVLKPPGAKAPGAKAPGAKAPGAKAATMTPPRCGPNERPWLRPEP
uniref:C-type lectin domain-containing protein n=1 Tax=Macrostomum lignano TaxID=282301 RepID=A0A1I8GVX6_9PLAT